ncbi:MAG TPA: vitamin K epoxide reductase family protein [Longimicrobiales bacterium]|nr:vitamin K epoxide reductase family protein [Longimicrobiales bacterium]
MAVLAEEQSTEVDEVGAPWHRMGIAVLALAGLLIAGYLLLYKIRVLGTIACGSGGCETVQASPWAVFLGVPVPVWGVIGYLLIFVLALLGLQPRFERSRLLGLALFTAAATGFAFSAYLTGVEAFLIRAWCRWCVGSAIVATLIFALSLVELPGILRRVEP